MMDEAREELTIGRALAEAARRLRAAGVAEPRREAASLLAHALGRDRTFLLTHAEAQISGEELVRYEEYVARRAHREPLQYITRHQEFFKLDFEVTPDVLIPRPETELLVEAALKLARDDASPFILDLGTGSGCIIVSLLHELPHGRGRGADLSTAALKIAHRNAARHGVWPRLSLLASDGFSALATDQTNFSMIVSNPPYIDASVIQELQPEVRLYEPLAALTPGVDGAAMIRRLMREAPRYLAPAGHLVFEIGFDQGPLVEELIDPRVWHPVAIHKDLQGIPRTVVLKLKPYEAN